VESLTADEVQLITASARITHRSVTDVEPDGAKHQCIVGLMVDGAGSAQS
jgi:hypothetical protein